MQESTVSLDALLVEQCGNLRPLAQAKELRLEVEAPDQPVWLRTDRVKLGPVSVSNLLGNAIKFTQNGGIVVSVSVMPEQVLIRIRDTGVGIAAEYLDRIFDEFAQLQNGIDDHGEGWGLGLSICRRLIEALGGGITVAHHPQYPRSRRNSTVCGVVMRAGKFSRRQYASHFAAWLWGRLPLAIKT